MYRKLIGGFAVLSLFASNNAAAGPKHVLQPVPVGAETVRFQQGEATLDLQRPGGAVQVTPLGLDHGSLAFGIAVYNDGKVPANIDITNFEVTVGAERLAVFSKDELVKKAQNRAMWASIAVAAAGGLAAAAAASSRDTYHHTFVTPRGTYRSIWSAPSAAGQAAAAASVAGAGVGIYAIQNQLDKTREALGAETVQLTTVDPGDSYAGKIVLQKIKAKVLPLRISFVVNWNGEAYPFAFQMVKPGTPQPVFAMAPAPVAPEQPATMPALVPAAPAPIAPVATPTASVTPVA